MQYKDNTAHTDHLAPQESGKRITDQFFWAAKSVFTAPGKIVRTLVDPKVLLPLMMLTAPYARAASLEPHTLPESAKPDHGNQTTDNQRHFTPESEDYLQQCPVERNTQHRSMLKTVQTASGTCPDHMTLPKNSLMASFVKDTGQKNPLRNYQSLVDAHMHPQGFNATNSRGLPHLAKKAEEYGVEKFGKYE